MSDKVKRYMYSVKLKAVVTADPFGNSEYVSPERRSWVRASDHKQALIAEKDAEIKRLREVCEAYVRGVGKAGEEIKQLEQALAEKDALIVETGRAIKDVQDWLDSYDGQPISQLIIKLDDVLALLPEEML